VDIYNKCHNKLRCCKIRSIYINFFTYFCSYFVKDEVYFFEGVKDEVLFCYHYSYISMKINNAICCWLVFYFL